MKFGVSYNVFNGDEHFIPSLKSLRSDVDYINAVVQYTSNYGENCTASLAESIEYAKKNYLVDEVIEYDPVLSISGQENELRKRNIGLLYAKKAKVDYFMTLDVDEYYIAKDLQYSKKKIIREKLLTTGAHSYLHIKRPIYRSKFPDTTCVCFFTRIEACTKILHGDHFPIPIDPTRGIHGDRDLYYTFLPDEIAMMHMNLVRKDGLASKLRNTSSAHMVDFIKTVKEAYHSWEFGKTLYFPNKPPIEIIETEDYFNIDHIFVESNASVR